MEEGTCPRLDRRRLTLLISPVPTPGDGQVDFEEFVTLLGPKLSTMGIPERFHGTDFDTVFWKVRRDRWEPGLRTRWSGQGVVGPLGKGVTRPSPSTGLPGGGWENGGVAPSLLELGGPPGWGGCRRWVGTGGRGGLSVRLLPKCDMQKLTVDELKRLLYDTFCEHLSMKDIENIIMTEEESHLGTAECPVDVESE